MAMVDGCLRSKLGMMVGALLLCAGCGDDGGSSADGGTNNQAGAGGGAGGQHLEMDLEATTSDSTLISFHCDLDYTVDIHGTMEQTVEWVQGYLDDTANSVVFRHPLIAIDMDDSLLSDEITMEMMDGVVGLPGIYGTPTFVATCGDVQVAQ